MIAFKDLSPALGARFEELYWMLSECVRGKIEAADWPTVKRGFLAPSSDVREIVVVSEGEDMAGIATVLSWEPFLDPGRGCIQFEPASQVARRLGREPRIPSIGFAFEMAELGTFRLAPHPEEIDLVPEVWRPFLVSLDELDEVRNCRIIREPHACFVSFAEKDGYCLGSRSDRDEQ